MKDGKSLAIAYGVKMKRKGGRPSINDAADKRDMLMLSEGGDIVDEIIKKRKRMADGGDVDLEENAMESRNVADDLNYDALRKELYDLDQLSDQPEDSNLIGDDIDSDEHDDVDAIRKKMRMKSRLK